MPQKRPIRTVPALTFVLPLLAWSSATGEEQRRSAEGRDAGLDGRAVSPPPLELRSERNPYGPLVGAWPDLKESRCPLPCVEGGDLLREVRVDEHTWVCADAGVASGIAAIEDSRGLHVVGRYSSKGEPIAPWVSLTSQGYFAHEPKNTWTSHGLFGRRLLSERVKLVATSTECITDWQAPDRTTILTALKDRRVLWDWSDTRGTR